MKINNYILVHGKIINIKNNVDEKYIRQIKRLDNYADQVLYYIRSNYAENDYLFVPILYFISV